MACSVQGLELIVDSQFFGHILDGVSQCEIRGWKERGEEQCCEYTVEWSPSPLMHPVVKGSYSNRFVEESTTVRDRLPYNLDLWKRVELGSPLILSCSVLP